MRKIYFIRHGLPQFPNNEGYCIGSADFPLSDEGRQQAEMLAQSLESESLTVFTSPLKRAYDTAKALSPDPIIIDDLREMHAGDWDGLSFTEIRKRWPELFEARATDKDLELPNAEDRRLGGERFYKAVMQALGQCEGDIAIVAHTTVILSFICRITGDDKYRGYEWRQDYASYYLVRQRDDSSFECEFPWRY